MRIDPKSLRWLKEIFSLIWMKYLRPQTLGSGEPEQAKMAAKPPIFASELKFPYGHNKD